MGYSTNMQEAAHRHMDAAEELQALTAPGRQPRCGAVAGYLYGLAGEMAIKQLLHSSTIRKKKDRKDDPYYAHFPKLRDLVMDRVSGRKAAQLNKLVNNPRLFQFWDVGMRYAPTAEITAERIRLWRRQARQLMDAMEEESP